MLAAFLIAAVGLACALAFQAFNADRSHRATAQAVLADYAGVAAAEYGRVTREQLSRVFDVAFDEIPRRYRPGRMPHPVEIRWDLDDAARAIRCACPSLQDPQAVFRMDLADGDMVDGGMVVDGDFPGFSESDITDLVERKISGSEGSRYGLGALAGSGGLESTALILWGAVFNEIDTPVMAYGVVLDAIALAEMGEHGYASHDLLPRAITEDASQRELVRVELRLPPETLLYASHGPAHDHPVATDTLGRALGHLTARAWIPTEAAERLIIGGLPSSRLPFSLALLALTLVVGAAGLWEVRRHQHLAQLREDFISSVSHELRTPLTQIRMLAELQADGKLRSEEERVRASRVMAREAGRLTHLVENILQFSRSRALPSRATPALQTMVAEVVSEVAEAFAPQTISGREIISVEVPPDLTVVGSPEAVRQILSNLVDNALKYGPAGQTVKLRAGTYGAHVRLAVEDDGPGIAPDHRDLIWEPYVRLPRDMDGPTPGSGIGLAVVRAVAAELEGRAWVEERPGGGSRFVVELPSAHGSSSAHGSPSAHQAAPSGASQPREADLAANPAR